jgi:DnaJ-class molecular chaperone
MEIRIPSMGHAGTGQLARNGDLYVTVKIQEDPVFKVLDDDVYVDLHLSLAHFFLGISDLEVPLPEGGTVRVVVAANTPIGTTKVLKGRGLAKVGKSRGDLVAKLNLKEYKALSPRQIQLIKEFDR